MMTNDEFEKYLARLGLPLLGQNYLREVRLSPPARRVRHGRNNVNVRYPSKKMGRILQAESRTCEFPFLVVAENDPNVVEIWDQPLEMKISYVNAKGAKVGPPYTADYLLLERTNVIVIECKPVDVLKELVITEPGKYSFENGQWHCPPAETAAGLRGFVHIIRTPEVPASALFSNLMYLSDYTLETTPKVPDSIKSLVKAEVTRKPGIRLSELRLACPDGCSQATFVDHTNTLIVDELIHIDLTASALEHPEDVHVFPSKAQVDSIKLLTLRSHSAPANLPGLPTLSIGAELQWGQRLLKVENIVDGNVTCSSPEMPLTTLRHEDLNHLITAGDLKATPNNGKDARFERAVKMLLSISHEYLEIANERLRAILPYLSSEVSISGDDNSIYIRNLYALTKRLSESSESDLVAKYIAGLLSPTTNALLKGYRRGNNLKLRQGLLDDLHNIMRKYAIYDKERFSGVTMSDETNALIQSSPQNTDFPRLNRLLLLNAFPNELSKKPEMERSLRRWTADFRRAEINYGFGFQGLIPTYDKCGNRKGHISEATQKLMEKLFVDEYKTTTNASPAAFYRIFVSRCEANGIDTMTKKTVYKWLNKRNDYETQLSRIGPRGVYSQKPFAPTLAGMAPKSEFPWQRCHIDHTLLDVQVIIGWTGTKVITARVWCSVLFDDYSRRVLAITFLLDSPSYRSCMCLLRECYSRWRRLPQCIIVDNGKDFNSTYFEVLLASFNVIKEERPPHEPRFGSGIERYFGTNNSLFVHQLNGNTKLMKNVRQVSKRFSPDNLAVWPFEMIVKEAEKFAYVIYDQRPAENSGLSPKNFFDQGITMHGHRTSREIDEETFYIISLPAPPRLTAKVVRGRGIKLFGFYYCCNALLDPDMVGKKVFVRYDPFDISRLYVFASDSWQEATCHLPQVLRNISERRLRLASRLFRHQRRNGATCQADYEKELGAFLLSCRDKELEYQAIKDALQSGGCAFPQNQNMKLITAVAATTGGQIPAASKIPHSGASATIPKNDPPVTITIQPPVTPTNRRETYSNF